jgi:methylenetetrahydrofolate reductase (NADPH)
VNISIQTLIESAKRPLLSYEFFPPKDDAGMSTLRNVAEALRPTHPDFVTVTYGAGGSTRRRTLDVCQTLDAMAYGPVVHHLTCVGASREDLGETLDEIHAAGIRNIMALRGDPPKGETTFTPHPDGLAHASDLVAFIRERHPDICCGVAGYPEMHVEAESIASDIRHVKNKLAAGGAYVTTQLFYDNRVYFEYVKRCRNAGITAPIIPGLLPALSLNQLQRMAGMCKASLPQKLVQRLKDTGDDAEAAEAVGIAWSVEQIEELLQRGVPGVHLYILNRSKAALTPALVRCFKR